ncbi:hypothetical protein [Hymenobacter defluvii]|uniref:DUF4469 domain-containing protein n=1 Tax=Hymenobacter defluvii TaxID=2054411 RepID=A0ABS3TCB4_9BACT|nr:hypothetical protein [Hymenobacter defluvii]MBO3271297.1 hypothetical protein [Hymenobacter defluvii]
MPDSLTLVYGQTVQLSLPAEYNNLKDATLAFDFKANPRIKLNDTDSLSTFMRNAVTFNSSTNTVTVDAGKLYPNGMTSITTSYQTPRVYTATLVATSTAGFQPVKSTIKIRVVPTQLAIKDLSATDKIPYAYAIYSKQEERYTVDYQGINPANTYLYLHVNGRPDGKVNLVKDEVVVSADAGDPAQKSEWIYDLIPILTKDGYEVARKQFRVVLMPKPKFFFGTYYSDYDLTILENRIVMGLGNAYTSKAPTFSPDKYKGKFSMIGIKKDGAAFTDTQQLFTVDEATGKVSVAANTTLKAGAYEVTVQTQATTGLVLTATFTLVMEPIDG